MQIGDTQLSTAVTVLFFLLVAVLIVNVFLFKRGHESYSIKYELMRKENDVFRIYPVLVTGLIQLLYKLLFISPVVLVIVIAIIKAMDSLTDLPIVLINGLIILLITLSFKQQLYFYRMAALWALTVASQFINLFIQSSNKERNYYQLLCAIFYPINVILFCLALLSKEVDYCDVSYLVKLAGLKIKEELNQEMNKKQVIDQEIEIIKDKFIKIPQVFDGGLFGYLRRGQGEGYNLKFTALYALSLCVLGVNAFTVWRTSGSGLGVIGLVTNFVYDLFVFAFNNLATPQRSVRNVFALVFVGRFLSFAFGEQLWIFGYCVLYFCVGTFVGQIIINDRLPLRNFRRPRGRTFEDALKTPEFVLFILTVEIVCLVAASSFGIASARTDVAYSEEVAVPLWQFAALMVGCTWTAILVLATVRIFRRKENRIKADAEYYFGSERVKEYHVYALATYLLIVAVGLYCKYYLLNSTALYTCIFLPAILVTFIVFISLWSTNKFDFQATNIVKKKKKTVIFLQSLERLPSRIESNKEIQYDRILKSFLPFVKSKWIQNQPQSSKNLQRKQTNPSKLQEQKQKVNKFPIYFKWIVLIFILLVAGLVLTTYLLAQSTFGIFISICFLSVLSIMPFYRYVNTFKGFSCWEIIWYELCFATGVVYWSIFHQETGYAMIWGGLNLSILALFIVYGVLRNIDQQYYLQLLILNFILTTIFIITLLAFTASPFITTLVSVILFLTCLAAATQFIPIKTQLSQRVKAIVWGFIAIAIIVSSICAFLLGFVSNFGVFTFVIGFIYGGLMLAGGIQYYSKEKGKYESPHVYSAYGLPIFRFDSKNECIKSSTSHKVLFDFGSAALVIYGATVSLIYSNYQIAIFVLGYYSCTTFFQSILFSIKTYIEFGQKKNELNQTILLSCLQQVENKYMPYFKENLESKIIEDEKYAAKKKAVQATTPAQLNEYWKKVANLDFQLIQNKQSQQRFFYLWLLLIQFHLYTDSKANMINYIHHCQEIQNQLAVEDIELESLSLAFDFQTKYQLLQQEINDLSPIKYQIFQELYLKHTKEKEVQKEKQIQKGEQIKQQQYQKEKVLFENLQQLKSQSKEEQINEFNSILKKLGDKEKYQDPDFLPNSDSLGVLASVVQKWRRPLSRQELIRGDISPYDVRQGNIGDCYLVSSLGVLGNKWILPALGIDPQSKAKRWQNQKGAYMIRFFKFGKQIFIFVDDFLPVDQHDSYVFAKSEDELQIWPCILEKAYAKLYGGYENIIAGQCHRVLSELSGGVPFEVLTKDFQSNPYALWQKILNCIQNQYLMAAGSNPHEDGDQASSNRNIVFGHAYSILDAKEVDPHKLIKLKNPHGSGGKEWTGDFSDESEYMDERMMQILQYQRKDDGIFWMKLEDFMHQFRSLYICKVFGDKFKKFSIEGQFTQQNSYGTPGKSDQTFRNPQYGIVVKSQSMVFVNLTQQDAINNYLGKNFIFVRIHKTNGKRISRYNKNQGVCGLPQKLKNTISVTTQVPLEADSYPCTFTLFVSCENEGDLGKYKLEIYCTDKQAQVIMDNSFDRSQFN